MSKKSSSFRRISKESHKEKFLTTPNLLILEKALEQSGQEWIENINIIEQLLVRLVDRLGQDNPNLKSKFITRRLQTYQAPFLNKNEYGIILEDIKFTITPPSKTKSRLTSSINSCQTEIFHTESQNGFEDKKKELSKEPNVLNEAKAYCSHEIFKRFTSAFVDAYQAECENNVENESLKETFSYSGDVQLLGPHLLKDLKENSEVEKIFKLNQSPLPIPKNLKSKCSVNVNYLKSMITINYDDTEVIVRPCLFHSKGYPRVNSNILDRLPLHHPLYLQIGESLQKGFLLFPTSFDTLWTLQFWPSESHIISLYHPSSIIARVFKLYSTFCLNPTHFWETFNTCFLVGDGSFESLIDGSKGNGTLLLNSDFVISSFAFEIENFFHIEDWAPRNFSTRLMHLMRTAVDSYEKGFHTHYFTKVNILREIWKTENNFEKEENSVLRELDDITESQEDLDDYGEQAIINMNDLEDDFGFQFEDLETIDDENVTQSRPNSATIYKSLNPRNSRDIMSGTKNASSSSSSERPSTLSRMFGSNLMKKWGNKLSRRHSVTTPGKKRESITDLASSFEESIAQMRRPDSLRLRFKFQTESDLTETSFSESQQTLVHSKIITSSTTCAYQNDGFQSHVESVYSIILQSLTELPPSDYLSDQTAAADLERSKRALESQEELITIWSRACCEFLTPKYICPHAFSPKQIEYLSLVIQTVSKCSPNMIQMVKTSKVPAWEISGDILRTVLHQMRMDVAENDTLREKQRGNVGVHGHLPSKYKDVDEEPKEKKSTLAKKFSSLKKQSQQSFSCKHKIDKEDVDAKFSLEEPEIAATNRLLEWLWNLRCSEIGRLSARALNYIQQLYQTSLINSYFLDQLADDKTFMSMAIKSAIVVTRIMSDVSYPVNVPLCAATSKGWLWAEMILSLASWNNEKGYIMRTTIPNGQSDSLERVLGVEDSRGNLSTLKKKPIWQQEHIEPDLEAATLAYHSEMATPIGWNDFEDPRRPGPLVVAILIFSSTCYYKQWEMSMPGNIVHVLVRLQKFNSLQHVGQMLNIPHKKTAMNEIRKLNKTLSLRINDFEDNVMSKTFRRLTSLRATRSRMMRREHATAFANGNNVQRKYYSCRDVGCKSHLRGTLVTIFNGTEFECTKL